MNKFEFKNTNTKYCNVLLFCREYKLQINHNYQKLLIALPKYKSAHVHDPIARVTPNKSPSGKNSLKQMYSSNKATVHVLIKLTVTFKKCTKQIC